MTRRLGWALALVGLAATSNLWAAEYFVEPGASGDGSEGNPFGSIDEALSAAADGDTVWLLAGDYGDATIHGDGEGITVAAAEGETPAFSSVEVAGSGWTVSGLHVSGESAGDLVSVDGSENTIESFTILSTDDTSGWSVNDWDTRTSNCMGVSGTQQTIRNNVCLNVNFGISVGASESLIEGNLVENFAGDGLRGLGDYTVFQYNTVKNCYDVNENHDDGFQSWTRGDDGSVGTGEVVGIVLRGNTIINYEDPDQPHRGTLQGIGCFDGTFVDWVVENNVVITDHWHGITLMGARNCLIQNNTVLLPPEAEIGPPWVRIDEHKDGTAPTDCIVRNNLATDFSSADSGVTEDGNIEFSMDDLASYFVDAENYDVHLVEDADAVDAGTASDSPDIDHDGIPRPQGNGIDVGAYEWHDDSVEPVWGTGGTPPGTTGTGGTGGTGGSSSGSDSGGSSSNNSNEGGASSANADSGDDGGCGCAVPTRSPASYAWLVALVALAVVRRRRCAPGGCSGNHRGRETGNCTTQ